MNFYKELSEKKLSYSGQTWPRDTRRQRPWRLRGVGCRRCQQLSWEDGSERWSDSTINSSATPVDRKTNYQYAKLQAAGCLIAYPARRFIREVPVSLDPESKRLDSRLKFCTEIDIKIQAKIDSEPVSGPKNLDTIPIPGIGTRALFIWAHQNC